MLHPRLATLFIPLVLAIGACGPAPTPITPAPTTSATATAPPAIQAQNETLDMDSTAFGRIDADLRYLASPELAGRGTGDPGGRLAAEFIRTRFQQLGLRPEGDAVNAVGPSSAPGAPQGDAVAHSYFQRFQAKVGAKVDDAMLVMAHPRDKVPTLPCVTADGSSDGDVGGTPVFVGYGITAPAASWDDYAGQDLAGKIAVVLAGAPRASKTDPKLAALRDFGSTRYKIRTAREHKAAAVVILVDGDLPAPPTDPSGMGLPAVVMKQSSPKSMYGLDIARWVDWDAKKPAPPNHVATLKVRVRTKIEPLTADAWNVLGALPAREGSPHASEWVVVGAHYDHLGMGNQYSRAPAKHEPHFGADDNASGTAMMLEVAHRLSKLSRRPLRNVLFAAFGAEEVGLIGSRYLVEHSPVPVAQMTAMINADMVGRMRDRQLLIDGMATANGWTDLVKSASDGLRLKLTFGAEGYGASDHSSFTAAKVPIAFLFTGVHDDYHMPSDTADKINVDGVSTISVLAARLARSVADQDARMAFVEPPSDPNRGVRGGFKVSIGTLPDYAYQGKGLRLTGVRPDSPASRAGLASGDVIVKLDKHEITNIHDYMFALGELEAGRKTTVEVERGGKRIVLDVVPAPGMGSGPEPKKDLPPNHP